MLKRMDELTTDDKVIFHCGTGGSEQIIHVYTNPSNGETTVTTTNKFFALKRDELVFVK